MKWIKDEFVNHEEDFKRICDQLTGKKTQAEWDKNYQKLRILYRNSPVVPFKRSTWDSLNDTDSTKKMTMVEIKKVLKVKDLNDTVSEVVSKTPRALIILEYRSRYWLVDGNKRLMISRLLDVTPQAVIMQWR